MQILGKISFQHSARLSCGSPELLNQQISGKSSLRKRDLCFVIKLTPMSLWLKQRAVLFLFTLCLSWVTEGSAQVDRCSSILYLKCADETLITEVRTWKAGEACRGLSVTHPTGLTCFCSCLARASQMALFNCKRMDKYNLPSSRQESSGRGDLRWCPPCHLPTSSFLLRTVS